jgi:small subunit ribosomal protein S5
MAFKLLSAAHTGPSFNYLFGRSLISLQTKPFGGQVEHDPAGNRYQNSRMLFFNQSNKNPNKSTPSFRPKTINEIKKLQSFIKDKKTQEGESLNESIRGFAKRDETFNDFLKAYRAKNEHKWASIVDLTQEEQERRLLEKTPEYRRNEMVMLDEFRRRKNMKIYYEKLSTMHKKKKDKMIFDEETIAAPDIKSESGPERFFKPGDNEIFNPKEFNLLFIDSDHVTNVTRLNRVMKRRVLLFIGNSNGVISYGKGKGEDYEIAFDNAFKDLRKNLICINLDSEFTCSTRLEGKHGDFKLTIHPQTSPNYWGNPMIWHMLVYTGIFHARFVCVSRKKEPYSMVYAFMEAVCKNKTPEQMS